MADDGAEDALARMRRHRRQRREGSSLALIEVDMAGLVTGWNARARAVYGWTEAEIVGRPLALLATPAVREEAEAHMPAMLRGQAYRWRWPNLRKDGSAIVCEWHYIVLQGERGEPEGVVCEIRDVTAEEALQQRQRLMVALADHSPLGIFAKGPDGRHVYANAAFAATLGLRPEDILGRDDFALFDPAIAADLRRNDAEIVAGGRPLAREDAGVGPNADRFYWTLKFPLVGEDGAATVCGIISDVTDRRQAEQARADLQAQVIASQQALLVELSSPLIPLADGVLAMPLIGTIDAARAEQIVEALLAGVTAQRARTVILDVTGVRAVDTRVAEALLRAARAVRLLGAEAVLTGVGPEVAETLVGLGVDLGGLVTLASLRHGIEHARRRR
ncbi:MAG: PAS domain-containing protein [Myxococcales bacterium]|nr:PAS domain-containing protein [Myxococcales bacterium]